MLYAIPRSDICRFSSGQTADPCYISFFALLYSADQLLAQEALVADYVENVVNRERISDGVLAINGMEVPLNPDGSFLYVVKPFRTVLIKS